jgi:hypothetical protein
MNTVKRHAYTIGPHLVEIITTPPLKHATWFDGGYLGNGHCSFMWARNGKADFCSLSHGHEGPHLDSTSDIERAALSTDDTAGVAGAKRGSKALPEDMR